MTKGTIKLLKNSEEIKIISFHSRFDMKKKLTSLRTDVMRLQFYFLYEISVTLNDNNI